jgi:hypothetical protein
MVGTLALVFFVCMVSTFALVRPFAWSALLLHVLVQRFVARSCSAF